MPHKKLSDWSIHSDSFVAVVFPSAQVRTGHRSNSKVVKLLTRPANHRSRPERALLTVRTQRSAEKLMKALYGHKKWFNSPQVKQRHVAEKFSNSSFDVPVRVFHLRCSKGLEAVVECKKRIRRHFGIGTCSIHVTDTYSEAKDLHRYLAKHFA